MNDDLILSRAHLRTHGHIRELTRAVADGRLVRVRQGVYIDSTMWARSDDRERHLIRVRAAHAVATSPGTLAGYSAAAAWGMPVREFPEYVSFQEEWRGGGRSAPGVRRISAGGAIASIERVGGLAVTNIARTALELTRTEPFALAVGSVDWALWRKNPHRISAEDLLATLDGLTARFGIQRALRAVRFATHLSDSFGESWCRALIFELGFEVPVLQQAFTVDGNVYETDYYWPSVGVAGEFDGKGKYLRSMRDGEDPGQVVWREKKREDALRTRVRTMVRPIWADLEQPSSLVRKLVDAGVPRWRWPGGGG